MFPIATHCFSIMKYLKITDLSPELLQLGEGFLAGNQEVCDINNLL